MKYSTETIRFLNHVERERDKISTELSMKIALERHAMETERQARVSAERENKILWEKNITLESELIAAEKLTDSMVSAARALLPKIRADIYTKGTSTPRWFKTGKWWSRETGGLDPDFVAEMTPDELQEALEFYGTTDLPLMLPKSKRAEIEENEIK